MVLLIVGNKPRVVYSPFIAPAFDENAICGIPDVDSNKYTSVYQEGMPFSAHVCGEILLYDDRCADVFFTNDAKNDAWLKLRVYDKNDNVIAETGLIKPGEYIKSIEFSNPPQDGGKVKLKIMAYEPYTYYSIGSVTLNTVIGN